MNILDVVALSPLQRGLYTVSSLAQGVDPYLVTFAVRVEGLTDLPALRRAFDGVLQRYPHLGAAVLAEDVPHPVLVITSDAEIGWRELDLRDAADPDEAARELYWAEARTRIDLDRGPLFRVVAARVGDNDYELVCTAHHIVVDGWSIPLLFADLIALHSGAGAALPPAPPLREHAAWLATRDTEASGRAWAAALDGLAPMAMIGPPAPSELDLPIIGEARLDRTATEALTSWARANGLTLNTVLQLAWGRVLSGLTGRDDVVFGQTTSGRDASLPNADRLVGALVTTIPVRVRLDDRAPAEVGALLQRTVAQTRAHEYLGIAEITRQAGAGQLFDTLLVFENSPTGSVTAAMPMGGGATLTPRRVDSPSHYPLAVVPVVENGELICRVETRPDVLTTFDPDRMARRVLAVAARITDAPRCSAVDVLLPDEPAALTARSLPEAGRVGTAPTGESAAAAADFAVATENYQLIATRDDAGRRPTAGLSGSVATADAQTATDAEAHGPSGATRDVVGRVTDGLSPDAVDRAAIDVRVPDGRLMTAEGVAAGGFRTVPEALFAATEAASETIAVVDALGTHTYDEFGSAVRTLASGLESSGVRPGDAVAVMLPRDRRVLHAPFAVGSTGAVCVHVDPATPADRVAYLLTTSGAQVVLADADRAELLAEVRAQGVPCRHGIPDNTGQLRFADADVADIGARADSGVVAERGPHIGSDSDGLHRTGPQGVHGDSVSPAASRGDVLPESSGRSQAPRGYPDATFYVVFTSGTTGRPKGVAVPHRALLDHWSNHERRIFAPTSAALGRTLRIGHGWSTGFDAAWQPTVALLSGHTVVLLGDEVRTDAERIVGAIGEFGIDIFDTSPSMLNRLIAAGLFGSRDGVETCPLAILALGGEAISPDTWRRLQGLPDTRVINFYGPTETTVEALMADVHEHDAPTIGRPFDAMVSHVLDHRLRPVPPGGQGELYLSGPQLALGYLARPGTTAGAFVAGASGERRYRTGDLVRRAADGTVSYEGRIDSQVKINGYRVEPDEVSVVLRELDGVRHAAALAFTDNGRTRLGALVVGDRPVAGIRSELARRLPQFLVPTRIVQVDEIPLNRNDKLDVHAATALLARPAVTGEAAQPRTDTERALLAVLEAMSGDNHSRIGILDSLVDLGIDSIGVIDLVSRLRGAGYRISAREVLAAADLRDLAHRLDNPEEDEETAAEVIPAGTVLPLTALAREIISHGDYRYLAQSQVISLDAAATADSVIERIEALATAHPTLRSRLDLAEDHPALIVGETSSIAELFVVADEHDGTSAATHLADTVARLDPDSGRMIAATLLTGPRPRLVLSIHHLAVDVVSWLILVDDLRRMEQGQPPLNEHAAEPVTTSRAATPPTLGQALEGRVTDPRRHRARQAVQHTVDLGPDTTAALLRRCSETGVTLEDMLLMGCARVVSDTGDDSGRIAITRESHGRAPDDETRRVGWFTVEETVLVPEAGLAWTPDSGPAPLDDRTLTARGQIRLNHLGRFDVLQFGDAPWSPVPLPELSGEFGIAVHPDLPLRFTIDVNTAVVYRDSRPSLVAVFDMNSAVLDAAGAQERAQRWRAVLSEFAAPEFAGQVGAG
ncbi:putative non-ribosomal peptide synthetase [Nocardia nova SH22a]|uniref:Putative non-ribosomal peptide synthetase n=1 Tax=Nocardia nova SH22a TaxID=1415166 RepID=W5T960_9NOCA|nr:condensation domain-containing protein [Nocardia nova]AHH15674.1 putative non-ribosomal peptide synthetase [Nocardia nova SH22a]